jgi:hypothetical protein
MAEPLDLSRRKALKFIVGAPMLPLGGLATASMLSACGGSNDLAAAPATAGVPVKNFGAAVGI